MLNGKNKFQSYATDAHDQLSRPVKYLKHEGNNTADKDIIARWLPKLAQNLKSAIKFKLPDNGKLLEVKEGESIKRTLNTFLSEIHLPFPIVVLEFDVLVKNRKSDGDFVFGVERSKSEGCFPCLLVLEEKEDHISSTFYLYVKDAGWQIVGIDHLRLDKKTFDFYDNEKAPRKFRETVVVDFDLERIIVNYLCALSCNNAEIETDDDLPSPTKEKMRRSKGKLPTFTYKVLTIGGRKMNGSTGKGGTHNSPRIHLRRGHIRRLATKNVWVNACVVGDKSKGVIHKDYNMVAA